MAYETENFSRIAKGLLPIQCASTVAREPLPWPRHLPRPASVIARQAAARAPAPARAAAPATNRRPLPLVFMTAGLAGPGRIEGRGHAANCEGWTAAAVARAADRINAGYVSFRLCVDHGPESLATVADGRLQVRQLGGDLLCRWWPRECDRWIVDQVREREQAGNLVGASIEARNSKATTAGDVRLIESGDIVGISICLRAGPAYYRSGVVCGDGGEGDLNDLKTAMKYVARADGAVR